MKRKRPHPMSGAETSPNASPFAGYLALPEQLLSHEADPGPMALRAQWPPSPMAEAEWRRSRLVAAAVAPLLARGTQAIQDATVLDLCLDTFSAWPQALQTMWSLGAVAGAGADRVLKAAPPLSAPARALTDQTARQIGAAREAAFRLKAAIGSQVAAVDAAIRHWGRVHRVDGWAVVEAWVPEAATWHRILQPWLGRVTPNPADYAQLAAELLRIGSDAQATHDDKEGGSPDGPIE
jgi:hypothetical protein